jgi:Ser/Thr protein kinase RdoA (MazF antagonist)
MLAQEQVAGYLIERGLLGPEAVVDGGLVVTDLSRRNRNYRVVTREGPCFLLKQGMTAEAAATVAHEASVYQQLSQNDQGLGVHLPRYCGYDVPSAVLALELMRDWEDLGSFHLRTGQFPAGPAALLGTALGAIHRATKKPVAECVPAMAPRILLLHRPDARVFRDASAATLELIRIIQSEPDFCGALERLRASWRQEVLMHGDVKWDNCLVTVIQDGPGELKLIDWESAVPGDPAWDIGSALGHYLSCWLFSIPVTGSVLPQQFPVLAAYPLDAMKSAMAACWVAYVHTRGLSQQAAGELLLRSVQLAGARLVQTGFESAQTMHRLASPQVLHLQLALNILQRPREAAIALFGLPLRADAA